MNLQDNYILIRVDDEKVVDFDFDDESRIVKIKLGSDMIQEIEISYSDIYSILEGCREGEIYSKRG